MSYLDEDARKVTNITDDGLVRKTMIRNNEDGQNVSEHILGRVWINIKGSTADGIVFKDELFEEVSLCLGKAEQSKAIDQALVTMKHGEHALIEVYDIEKYGYSKGKSPIKCPNTNDNKEQFPLKYQVIVHDSLPKTTSHEMTLIQQLNHAQLLRDHGNKRYKKQKYITALDIYNRSIQCLDAMDDIVDDMNKTEINECKLLCYLNCAICHRQLNQHNECIEWCAKALRIDNKSKKAWIRRGLSHFDLANYDLAKSDFIQFEKLAENKKQKELIKKCFKKLQIANKKQIQKQKHIYGGFLHKKSKKNVSLYDDKKITDDGNSDNEAFWWRLMTAIPNGLIYAMTECRKLCKKTKKKN